MLLVRPDDLVAMLREHRLDVQAVYDADEVTLRVPDMGVLGFGRPSTRRSTISSSSFVPTPLASSASRLGSWPPAEATHAAALLRFALAGEDEQRLMLGLEEPERSLRPRRSVRTPTWDEFREFLRHDDWEADRATGHDFFEKTLPDGEILRTHASRSGSKTSSPGSFQGDLVRPAPPERGRVLEGPPDEEAGAAAEPGA